MGPENQGPLKDLAGGCGAGLSMATLIPEGHQCPQGRAAGSRSPVWGSLGGHEDIHQERAKLGLKECWEVCVWVHGRMACLQSPLYSAVVCFSFFAVACSVGREAFHTNKWGPQPGCPLCSFVDLPISMWAQSPRLGSCRGWGSYQRVEGVT